MVQQCLLALVLATFWLIQSNFVVGDPELLPKPNNTDVGGNRQVNASLSPATTSSPNLLLQVLDKQDVGDNEQVNASLSPATTSSPNLLLQVLDKQCSQMEIERCSNCKKQCLCLSDRFNDSTLPDEIDLNEFLQRWNEIDDISSIEEIDVTPSTAIMKEKDVSDEIVAPIPTIKPKVSKLLSLDERSQQLLDRKLFTDCTFVVGTENNTKSFEAHRIFFARVSSVFEALFNNTTESSRIRISNISPDTFEQLIQFVYTGSICLKTFSQACEMLHTASQLQISDLMQYCRSFLWTNLYPSNAWSGLQCAQTADDQVLKEAALQIIAWKTEDAIKDSAFTDISHSSLVEFLKRDDLNVSSEVKLYEASLSWAISEVTRQGLPQEPESLRKVLGTAIGLIRFFKFTPSEFANMQSTSKVLTYSESLSIIFNLNSPGVISIPTVLSTNNNSRIYLQSHSYFDALATSKSTCKDNTDLSGINTFDLYTWNLFQITSSRKLLGIQIPSQINCKNDPDNGYTALESQSQFAYEEDVTVYVMRYNSSSRSIIHSTRYKGPAKCNSLFTIPFTAQVDLQYFNPQSQSNITPQNNYVFKIVLHKSGRYPVSWKESNLRSRSNPQRQDFNGCIANYWYFKPNEFVFSRITKE